MWPVFVINLAENEARLAQVTAALEDQAIEFERIEAVNGWKLSAAERSRVYDAEANRRFGRHPLAPAEIGCYLSHIDAWKRIAASEAPGGFVLEDDFAVNAGFGQILDALAQDDGDWDMVKLFSLQTEVPLWSARPLTAASRIGIPYRVPTCLLGYGLRRTAARHLADRAIPFFRPVDEDQKFVWETGLRVALVTPPPLRLGDQQTVTGTVGAARRMVRTRTARELFHGIRYMLSYHRALRRHRRAEGWGE